MAKSNSVIGELGIRLDTQISGISKVGSIKEETLPTENNARPRIRSFNYMLPTETHARRLSTPEAKKLVPRTYSPKTTNEKKEAIKAVNLPKRNYKLVLDKVAEENTEDTFVKQIRKNHVENYSQYYS